ncbi:histidyl-tRNA synthetase [Buchnera aphidicola (Cinara tujafilina)]|uniref:Histidine--tRNA ligase n=1 Tax=Buchnera aphidicola (Cinara tujafilina) TaxID=261317 RepID=F7WZB3_9GAMM|nr:histidyl-tRNA synthetase [Buchnera aphidicola (Cinara tujafilina)]
MSKEMYSFYDRNKKKISLRPEGTVSCIRACIQHHIFNKSLFQKLWYYGPMFRYERPQKGRFRQFYQLGIEIFGTSNPISDFDIILLTIKIWNSLGILKDLTLEINSIGSIAVRNSYSIDLQKFCKKYLNKYHLDGINESIIKNPIRLLDSKDPNIKLMMLHAPKLKNYLEISSILRFKKLRSYLDQKNISYIINDRLVRGLDYYNDTVFEWKSPKLGTQNTICAGGRYDLLVKNLGGPNNSAIGCAIGIDRLFLLKNTFQKKLENYKDYTDIHIIFVDKLYAIFALDIAERLNFIWPQLKIYTNITQFNLSNQIKYAIQNHTKFLLILDSYFLGLNKMIVKNISKKNNIKNIFIEFFKILVFFIILYNYFY